jgi:Ice-binding-like
MIGKPIPAGTKRRRGPRSGYLAAVGTAVALIVVGVVALSPPAFAAQPPVGLGTADAFAVLAGATVTNTGPSVITGDLGVSPGTAVTGFPPGTVNGTVHAADAVALQAQADLTTAYNDAAGRIPPVLVSSDLGGQTLVAGVYRAASALALTGTVTLDAQGDPNAVFIFQAGSTLITASNSTVALINGAQACNVFWQVGSSATLGTNTTFVGNILALTSASVLTGATVAGRVLARNGQVSLDSNVITRAVCAPPTTTTAPPTSTTTAPPTSTTTAPPTSTTTAPPGATTAPPTTTAAPTTTAPPTTTAAPTTAPATVTTAPSTIGGGGVGGPGSGGGGVGGPGSGAGVGGPGSGAGVGGPGSGAGSGAGNGAGTGAGVGSGSGVGSSSGAGNGSGVGGAGQEVIPAGAPDTGVGGAVPHSGRGPLTDPE